MHRARRRRVLGAVLVLALLGLFACLMAGLPAGRQEDRRAIVVRSGTGVTGIAAQLKGERMIRSATIFTLFAIPRRGHLIAGEYTLSPTMSTLEIIGKMARGERNIYAVTIREGDNLYDVARESDRLGLMAADAFLQTASSPGLRSSLSISGPSLEGYLAPDTYYYSREVDMEQFLLRIARRTLDFFADPSIAKRMKDLNLDVYKTLTLASLVEREAKIKEEKPLISAVFHNRLARGMPLECDPTVIYGTRKFGQPITRTDLKTPTPYNTYTFAGLPKGPIANPDRNSITAALYPAPVDYLFFVSRNDGSHAFSKRMHEHNRYVMMYQRAKKTKHHQR